MAAGPVRLTGESGAATLGPMRRSPTQPDASPAGSDGLDTERGGAVDVTSTPTAAASVASLADLPVAGLTRRRIALLIGALVAAWVVVLFARQVGEASEATARAENMRIQNARLEADVAAL